MGERLYLHQVAPLDVRVYQWGSGYTFAMAVRAWRILIIKPSSLGDIVHGLPVLAALRRALPDAHIAWMVANSFAPLLEDHPLLDQLIRFDRSRYGRMWRSPRAFVDFWRFVDRIRRERFDLVIDLQGLIRSGLLSYFSWASKRVGFADAREGAWLFYTLRVKTPPDVEHAVDKNLALVNALELSVATPEFPLAIKPAEHAAARELLAGVGILADAPFVAIIPGARWTSKQWQPDKIGALIDRIHTNGLPRCVLLGAPDERDLAERVLTACRTKVADLVGRSTLRELVAVIDLADRVICHDSGPMHIAAALDKPMVALFGPTNPKRTGPYSNQARVVTHPVDCAPCYRRECPYGHHDCLRKLEVETVLTACLSIQSGS